MSKPFCNDQTCIREYSHRHDEPTPSPEVRPCPGYQGECQGIHCPGCAKAEAKLNAVAKLRDRYRHIAANIALELDDILAGS